MTDVLHYIVRSSIPVRQFDDLGAVTKVAVFPDRRRMATNSSDGMVRLWDLETGGMLMELEGCGNPFLHMALSRDGRFIAGSDNEGYIIPWHGDTGRPLIQAFKPHSNLKQVYSLDFSPDGTTLATGADSEVQLWGTETWQLQGTIDASDVTCIRYSPSGELIAVAASRNHIHIWDLATKKRIASLQQPHPTASFLWVSDGCLLSNSSVTIREWDSSTWKQIGCIWKGSTAHSSPCVAVNCNGTIVASTTTSNHVRLWRLSDRRTVAIFQHSNVPRCITFSMDGKHILIGGDDAKISEWAVPEHAWPEDASKDQAMYQVKDPDTKARGFDGEDRFDSDTKILAMNTTVRDACINGDLTTAEDLLTQEIDVHDGNYHSYTSRSVVMARKLDWDCALDDATKSLSIQPSLTGYISKGIALCGKKRVQDARNAFDLASTFIDGDSKMIHSLYLIKSIALFNANQHTEAMKRLRELSSNCPNADTILACRIIEVYLYIQLGNSALDRANATEAANHFTAAVNAGTFLSKPAIYSKYEEFAVLFGCDFTSLWQTANQQRCRALLRAGKIPEVFEACRYMAGMSDESMKASYLDWTIGFMQEMSTFRGNAPSADAIPEIMMPQHDDDDDEKDSVSISDMDSDVDHVFDVVC